MLKLYGTFDGRLKDPDALAALVEMPENDVELVRRALRAEDLGPYKLRLLEPREETKALLSKYVINDMHAMTTVPAELAHFLSVMIDHVGLLVPGRVYPILGSSTCTGDDPKIVKVVIDANHVPRVVVEHCKKNPAKHNWDLSDNLLFPAYSMVA